MKTIAFAYEGGGPKGAHQAGATKALHEAGIRPTILSGISIGAINAAYYAQDFDIKGLENVWCASHKDVFKNWTVGYLQGFFKGSLKSASPLRKRLELELDLEKIRHSGIKLRIGAVSLTYGDYKLWKEFDPDLIDGIMASAAHPVFLPYVDARGEHWTDGGVRHLTPLRSAIRAGADEVWVFRSGSGKLSPWMVEKPNLVQRTIREFEIILNEAHQDDMKMCHVINAGVEAGAPSLADKRYIDLNLITPSKPLEVDLLDFTEDQMKGLFNQGYRDAQLYLKGRKV